ncbi:LamG-like jellyroll fold domain-containing protein [Streptomyces zingiberis]|uniref:LamG-like jellyroll fold domain-containing protein n=1 Tax=Streptomyces zingiberis TaxID=2053010 RepID=UPI0028936ECC|nr:LamG-like jellyroll fold domain-containing protein [Streptomyces zingiberis]
MTAVLALAAAGATGTAAAGEPAPRPATGAACTADGFCEDFESQTGTTPSGRWTVGAPNCSGTGSAVVDSTTAHTGGRSLRVDGRAGYCNHVFAATPLTGVANGSSLHVRFWVRHTTALPAAHVTFAAMKDSADNGKDLRMGGQNGALQWNRESDDATLPEQSPVGVSRSTPLPVNRWTCVEFAVQGSTLETRVDGAVVEGLVIDGTPTPDVDRQWLGRAGWRPSLTDLRFGWESYGNGDDTLWYDDIAVGTAPIGC